MVDKKYIALGVLAVALVLLYRDKASVPAYFSINDINSKGQPVPDEYRANAAELVKNLNIIQDELYKINPSYKINFTSTYRTPEHNASAGGVNNSRHLTAQAADFKVDGLDAQLVQKIVKRLVDGGKIKAGGVGEGESFTHYDIRGYKTSWTYTNGSGSSTTSSEWKSSQNQNGVIPVATKETAFYNDIDV